MKALLGRFRAAPVAARATPIRSTSRSHVGGTRIINEDRVLDRVDLGLWAVADGMGGQSCGDMAAEAVTGCLAGLAGSEDLTAALECANREIYEWSGGHSGTTVVLLRIDGGIATVRWAGDSRAYLIREGRLELITRDHSVVQQLVDAGLLDAGQAARHPQANVITRALGVSPKLELETISIVLQEADRLLLCSDGLSRTLEDRDVDASLPIAGQADRFLANALRRDGSDNISLVLVEVASAAGEA